MGICFDLISSDLLWSDLIWSVLCVSSTVRGICGTLLTVANVARQPRSRGSRIRLVISLEAPLLVVAGARTSGVGKAIIDWWRGDVLTSAAYFPFVFCSLLGYFRCFLLFFFFFGVFRKTRKVEPMFFSCFYFLLPLPRPVWHPSTYIYSFHFVSFVCPFFSFC